MMIQTRKRLRIPALLLVAACADVAWAGQNAASTPPTQVDYLRDVKPILAARCFACHGGLQQKSGLRLDASSLIRKGGKRGSPIVAGNSAESLIIRAVTGEAGFRMPAEGEPLSDEQIGILRAWIDQGAKAPGEEIPADPRQHWSYQPPVRPAVPAVENQAWVHNPIDAFVAAEHAKRGLKPLPEADRRTLLRRVYLDLIGLPPTPEEMGDFLADTSSDAYEKVVDRLLDSPQHGERWGRHWMDVWRYSDWAGYGNEIRVSQRHIWRWRDWIVEALNADKGYDRMIVEMLAGDEVAPADPDVLRATGFLARNWYVFNRNVWLDDTIEHTAKAFLGTTLNCSRCHDHKYDPIAQTDYYRFRAFFEPYGVRTDERPGEPDLMKDGLARVFDKTLDAPTYVFERGNESHPLKESPVTPGVPAPLGGGDLEIHPVDLPAVAYYPGLLPFVRQEKLAEAEAALAKAQSGAQQAQQAVTQAEERLAQLAERSSETGTSFLADNFAAERADVWQTGPGQWKYEGSRLVQSQVGDGECRLVSVQPHPQAFTAWVRFKITGGNQWKSVGLSFDVTEGQSQGVYLSAYSGGSKVQVFHDRAGNKQYPTAAAKQIPVSTGREYTLRIDVRDELLNVSVDGQLQVVYKLPMPRAAGRFAIWTFDASAEFAEVRIDPLSDEVKLFEKLPEAPAFPAVVSKAEAESAAHRAREAAARAGKAEATARAALASLKARIAADTARYANPPAEGAHELALGAGKAERQVAFCKAEEDLLLAQQQVDALRAGLAGEDTKANAPVAEAEKKLAEARQKRDAAQAVVDEPSESYSPITETYPKTSTGRRLALARWIANRQNPLTARVAINHIWMRHFGKPLVPTVFDFGLNGKPPTHPKLLDWLAVELMDSGWSMKHIHRLMVTSTVYRMQSGAATAEDSNVRIDPDNVYLWRMNPQRMEAEAVRDSVLYVAGGLDLSMGGPDLDQNTGQTVPRRSLYFRTAKEKQMTFLRLFDQADVNECYRRRESVVPQQALALANSSLAQSQSRLLARALSRETEQGGDGAFVAAAFERILGRPPSAAEQDTCAEFLTGQAKLLSDPAQLTAVPAGAGAAVGPSSDPHLRARENLVHVLFNHNEFVTIR